MKEEEINFESYFDLHDKYKSKYGDKTLILMQMGAFHECYSTDTMGPNLHLLSQQLGIILTKKSGKKEVAKNNPYMLGYPIYKIYDFIEAVTNLDYTAVVVDQTTEPPKPKREVTGIYSPTTYVEKSVSESKNLNLVALVLDVIKDKSGKYLFSTGVTSYDLTTGNGSYIESYSTSNDEHYCLDETIRFLENFPPREIIFYPTKKFQKILENDRVSDMSLQDICGYLNIPDNYYKVHNIELVTCPNYQQSIFERVFDKNFINENNFNYLNLAKLSLTILLNYTFEHQSKLVNSLKKPEQFTNQNKLFLGNQAINQINIINHSNENKKSLFGIVNYTKNILGKRFLKEQLINPLIDSDDINKRYELVEFLCNNNFELEKELCKISDIERIYRRILLKNINPAEFFNFVISLKQISSMFDNRIRNEFNFKNKYSKAINNLVDYVESNYDLAYMASINFINYKEESYNYLGKNFENLEELSKTINDSNNFLELFCKKLEDLIEDDKFMKKDKNFIHIKHNDRDGHYFLLSTRRCKKMQDKLQKINHVKFGNNIIKYTDLEFTQQPKSSNVKIQCPQMKNISNIVVSLKLKLSKEIKNVFYEEMEKINSLYLEKYINKIINRVGFLDFINSGMLVSNKLGYCKPTIKEHKNSFFEAKELRHPIVELINSAIEYTPHDISLGLDNSGILLYGINSSGKSTLMKSIGLAIVLAQIGYFVPAKEFNFKPYYNLFTRIHGNDDMYRGLSSYIVEVLELMAILKRNNENTLVIGDEICRGTEEKSANVIVAYMLEKLSNNNTSFITATHLHQICDLDSVQKLDDVKVMHLKVDYDPEKDILIYNRKLLPGQGDKFYGVTVAKYLMKDSHFNLRTKELENEYDNTKIQKSKYNSKVWMKECHICKVNKGLETHHINFQKDCNKYIVVDKPQIKKNSICNLVVLCSKCHDKIDSGELVINGWKETSDNIILDYHKEEKKTKKKLNDNQIEIVKSYLNNEISAVRAKKILEEKDNISISTNIISKIWKDKY